MIACRDEADTLWFTLHSLQMHTQGPLVERDGMEIVVADNDPGAEEAQWIFESRKHADTAALEASWTENGVFF